MSLSLWPLWVAPWLLCTKRKDFSTPPCRTVVPSWFTKRAGLISTCMHPPIPLQGEMVVFVGKRLVRWVATCVINWEGYAHPLLERIVEVKFMCFTLAYHVWLYRCVCLWSCLQPMFAGASLWLLFAANSWGVCLFNRPDGLSGRPTFTLFWFGLRKVITQQNNCYCSSWGPILGFV